MSRDGLPPVLWLGGGSGAGKTTISLAIALRRDLAWYRVDAHGYEHRDRLVAAGVIEDDGETEEQRWIAPTPAELARRFVASSRQVFPLILDDLRAMGRDVAVVVEGPQLFPSLVAPYVPDPAHGLWLLPSEDFQRRALAARARAESARFASEADAVRALENRLQRNRLLDARTRAEATERGLTVLMVDGGRDIPAMIEQVTRHYAPALASMPAARTGRQRQRMRQSENDAMARNVLAFRAELGSSAPAEWSLPFPCECEQLGCDLVGERTPTEYDELREAARPITSHRLAKIVGQFQ